MQKHRWLVEIDPSNGRTGTKNNSWGSNSINWLYKIRLLLLYIIILWVRVVWQRDTISVNMPYWWYRSDDVQTSKTEFYRCSLKKGSNSSAGSAVAYSVTRHSLKLCTYPLPTNSLECVQHIPTAESQKCPHPHPKWHTLCVALWDTYVRVYNSLLDKLSEGIIVIRHAIEPAVLDVGQEPLIVSKRNIFDLNWKVSIYNFVLLLKRFKELVTGSMFSEIFWAGQILHE